MLGFLRNLQAREKRALAVLALGLGVFLLAQFVLFPLMEAAGKRRASLPMKEKALRKYRTLAALIGPRETDWRNFQARLADAEKGLLDSRAAALASAELQERVKKLLDQHGIETRGVDFLPVKPLKPVEAGYSAVPLGVSFECTLDQLTNFLIAAAAGPKILALEQLVVNASPARPDRPKKMVTVRMTLRAVMLSEAPPAPAPKS